MHIISFLLLLLYAISLSPPSQQQQKNQNSLKTEPLFVIRVLKESYWMKGVSLLQARGRMHKSTFFFSIQNIVCDLNS